MATVAMIGVVLPAVDFVLAPDYHGEASVLRGRLAPVETQADFVGVAEAAGHGCRETAEGGKIAVWCFRTSGKHIWNWMSFLDPLPEGVSARGEFIDGRKSAEYQVKVERLGPGDM